LLFFCIAVTHTTMPALLKITDADKNTEDGKPMNGKENRPKSNYQALLLVLLLILLWITRGKAPEFWSFLLRPNSVAGGSDALAMNPAPVRIDTDSSKKKAGENRKDLFKTPQNSKPSKRKLSGLSTI